ncbi:hypothetical protein ABIC65_000235 [Sphingomonas trueperi]|uniref:KAP family P-loop NTPase fold protein n=1 Tax=Sphingomonas trueperi TaxID=53317 RepID=UPI00339605E0
MASSQPFAVQIDETIAVRENVTPGGDLVFLSISSTGSRGKLNGEVLERLGLDPDALPTESELVGGYALRETGNGLLCFIVTVGERLSVIEALRQNLAAALRDHRLAEAREIWLPLMGTGAGKVPPERSFRMTLDVLRTSDWLRAATREIVISLPTDITAAARSKLISTIETMAGTAKSPPPPPHEIPGGPAMSEAAGMLLAFAAGLKRLRKQRGGELSTTLLFYALAEVNSEGAPQALKEDRAAVLMSHAIKDRAGNRYATAWAAYFRDSREAVTLPQPVKISTRTPNLEGILATALSTAASAGRAEIEIDDLIEAMFALPEGRFNTNIEPMRVTREALLEEYRDMARGQVLMSLHNDVASEVDKLGYQTYADAIALFLTDTRTPPPISISIQAPWGAGKSSLMHMIREKLDPRAKREEFRPKPGDRSIPRLSLGDVLRFIDTSTPQPIKAFFGWGTQRAHVESALPSVPWGTTQTRLTIWFNAWKYETSEQVWAGLVDAIVSQISERLPPVEREKFLLRLQLARIDDSIIRRKIYDRIATLWWGRVRAWVGGGVAWLGTMFGLIAAPHVLDVSDPGMKAALGVLKAIGYPGALIGGLVVVAVLARQFFMASKETKEEPATFSLANYIRVPDYDATIGQIHHIHSDLRRVLSVTPKATLADGTTVQEPIVIFIDDLDRCTPGKIAAVVEGVSLLLADDTYRCMFVIGMDPQMVAAALEKAHEDVRDQLPSYERSVPLGWRFMDKFVQLPFTIPPSRQDRLDDLLMSMGSARREEELVAPTTSLPPDFVALISASPEGGSAADAPPTAPPVAPDAPPAPSAADSVDTPAERNEARDVGKIIRLVADYTGGNPREVKRMVNLARLYLHLRNARREAEAGWISPSLDQYARWIALTLRWPDMMRWLQWGVDEAAWAPTDMTQQLIERRLLALQKAAIGMTSGKAWCDALKERLEFSDVEKIDWAADSKLMEFFARESERRTDTIAAAAARGFW